MWTGSLPDPPVAKAELEMLEEIKISPGVSNKSVSTFQYIEYVLTAAVWIYNLESCTSVICFLSFFPPTSAKKNSRPSG